MRTLIGVNPLLVTLRIRDSDVGGDGVRVARRPSRECAPTAE
jgi:hypothetical protein